MSAALVRPLLAAVLVLGASVIARGPDPRRRLGNAVGGRASPSLGALGPRSSALSRRIVARVAGAVRPRRDAVATRVLVETWASELRAGRPVDEALAAAIDDIPSLAPRLARTRAALAVRGDVAAAMRTDAARSIEVPARRALEASAVCWTVAHRSGGRLADALERLAEAARADELHAAHVRAQLAGPRSTARLLAALPLLAVAMSSGVGLDPIPFLLGEDVGRGALVAGLLLDLLGLWWTARLARSAERTA